MTMTLYGRRISIVISIIITSTKAEVMWSVRFLCHSVYMQDYCKSNQSIFIESYCYDCPTNRKNWLTFAGDPRADTDSDSLFHFPHHCGIRDFRRFISISHTVTSWFSRHLSKWLIDADKVMNLRTFRECSRSKSRLIGKSGYKSWINFGWSFGLGGFHSVNAL